MSAYAFVLTWVLHSTVLGLVALLLPALFRLRDPRALASWWGPAAVTTVWMPLLPLLLPGDSAVPEAALSFVEQTTVAMGATLGSPMLLSPWQWLGGLWLVGVATRLGWLVAGHRRLRRMAARGVRVQDDPALDHARVLAPAAALPPLAPACVPVVMVANAGPCAFGWINACVIVPVALRDRPEPERLAVYLHELAHIARADVTRGYADEAWRLLWWWQPAVWMALAQLRLAREQEVDALVVSRTGGVRAYVEALLWCSTLQPARMPSLPVGSRRHALVRRVALMCEGGEMSRTRRWLTAAAMVLLLGGLSGAVGMVSPLRAAQYDAEGGVALAPGPLERAATRPTLDVPAPRRIVGVEPEWGDATTTYRFRTHLVIDASGRVAEARLVGPPATSASPVERVPQLASAREAALDAVRQWQFELPLRAPMLLVTDVMVGSSAGATQLFPRTMSTNGAKSPGSRPPLRVGGSIAPPRKLVDVRPEYPAVAKDANVSGVVVIETTIDPEGQVSDARVLRGIPLLDAAALTAVRGWQYEPTQINGEAVPVILTITVNFTLQ